MKVIGTCPTTTLFGSASAWPAEKDPSGINSILALEVGSILSAKEMNFDWIRYSEGEILTSNSPGGPGAEWVVRFEAACKSCYTSPNGDSVFFAGGNLSLSVAAIEDEESTYSLNRSSTQPYMSPYDLVRYFATTCNTIDSIRLALEGLIVWNDVCYITGAPLGLKFLILAQNRTLVITFVNGVPKFNEETIGMIATGVKEEEIVELAGGYDVGNETPPAKLINGSEVRSLGLGSNGRLIGGFSSLSKLTRLASLYKHFSNLTADYWYDNIEIIWPPFASVIAPPGSSLVTVDEDLYDISTRIYLIITNGLIIELSPAPSGSGSVQELFQDPNLESKIMGGNWSIEHCRRNGRPLKHIRQSIRTPSIPDELKGKFPMSYYFQGTSIMRCTYGDLIAAGNFNGLSLSETEDPLKPLYLESGRVWTSISSSGQKGLSWTQEIAFEGLYPPQKIERNIPIVLFAQNPTLMVRVLNYTPSTYSPQGFVPGASVGALDLACLIAGTCYSIEDVKELLEGKKLGLLNVVDQLLPNQGDTPHLQYHIATRPDQQDDPQETPVVLYFDKGVPVYIEIPKNIAVSDYNPKTCETSLAQLGAISPECPMILSQDGSKVPGPIGSGTNLLPQGVNCTDVYAKTANYLQWDPDLHITTLYGLTGSIAWDNRVTIEVNKTRVNLDTIANYWWSFNYGMMIWQKAPIFQ